MVSRTVGSMFCSINKANTAPPIVGNELLFSSPKTNFGMQITAYGTDPYYFTTNNDNLSIKIEATLDQEFWFETDLGVDDFGTNIGDPGANKGYPYNRVYFFSGNPAMGIRAVWKSNAATLDFSYCPNASLSVYLLGF